MNAIIIAWRTSRSPHDFLNKINLKRDDAVALIDSTVVLLIDGIKMSFQY